MSDTRLKIHDALKLITPLRVPTESASCYLANLGACIDQSKEVLDDPEYNEVVDKYTRPTQKFSYAALYLLQKLVDSFTGDPVEDLLSTMQQIRIRMLLQMVFSLGVLQCLRPSVNVMLLKVSKELNLFMDDNDVWPPQEHSKFLGHAVLQLISMLKTPNLRSLILAHLGGLISALLQLIHWKNARSSPPGETNADEPIDQQRQSFVEAFEELSEAIYKPLLIKELLILLTPKRDKSTTFPRWLNRAIIEILVGYLTKPGGVAMAIRACCPSNTEAVVWANVRSLAKIISTVHYKMDPDVYYSLISPQVISLLHATGPYCAPVAKMCIKMVYERDEGRCGENFLEKLFVPFILCSVPPDDKLSGTVISETLITRCLDNLNKCFNQACVESDLPISMLTLIAKIKFNLYMKIHGSTYSYLNVVEQLLILFLASLKQRSNEVSAKVFGALLFDESHKDLMLDMHPELKFDFGPSGNIHVVKNMENNVSDLMALYPKMDRAAMCFINLIQTAGPHSQTIALPLFVYLLNMVSLSFKSPINEEDFEQEWKRKGQQIYIVKMLVDLSENDLVMKLIKGKSDMLEAPIVTLIHEYLETSAEQQRYSTSLFLPLRLLDLITSDWQPGNERWKSLQQTAFNLRQIMEICPEDCKQMCTTVYQKIMTEGSLKNSGVDRGASNKPRKRTNATCDDNDLNAILEMIASTDPAIKGNGLVMLKKNRKKLLPDVISRKDEVFVLLKECINDADSYVYLSAISAFEAVFIAFETDILEYFCDIIKEPKGYCPLQLKIGEVLVRLTRISGQADSATVYNVIYTFFEGTKNEDEYLRASCLSNLGEMFKHYKCLSARFMYRMLTCIQNVLATDKSNVVRRAAALVAQLALQGNNSNPCQELLSALIEFYRTMRHVHQTDKDEVVRLHAWLALEELNKMLKDDLTRSLPLEKKISILTIDH